MGLFVDNILVSTSLGKDSIGANVWCKNTFWCDARFWCGQLTSLDDDSNVSTSLSDGVGKITSLTLEDSILTTLTDDIL